MMDFVVRDAFVVDGSGRPGVRADVAVKDGVIRRLGACPEAAAEEVDGRGCVLCPGFIDMHSHCDLLAYREQPVRSSRVSQGITTECCGQCGLGPAPFVAGMEEWKGYFLPVVGDAPGASWDWPAFSDFLDEREPLPLPHNQAYLMSHGALRARLVGLSDVELDERTLAALTETLDDALTAGAFGMSFGLSYLPGMYSREQELTALASTLAARDRVFMVHIRSHSGDMEEAVAEMIRVSRASGVRMHLSHLKSYRDRRRGFDADTILSWLAPARKEGLSISYDEHPYRGGSTTLSQLLPPWVRDGGSRAMLARLKDPGVRRTLAAQLNDPDYSVPGWDSFLAITGWSGILVSSVVKEENRIWQNRTLADIAQMRAQAPSDALCDVLLAEDGQSAMVMLDIFDDADLARMMQSPLAMVGSDGIPTGTSHPRLYGTFPLYFAKMRKAGVLRLEEIVHRATGRPAARLGLTDRGRIEAGCVADLVLFDPERFGVEEDYAHPRSPVQGLKRVWVAGRNPQEEPGRLLRAAH